MLTVVPVFLVTVTAIFAGVYHQSVGIAGLHVLAPGLGLVAGTIVMMGMSDRVYKHFKAKNGGVGKPEYRLREWHLFVCCYRKYGQTSTDTALVSSSVIGPWRIQFTHRSLHRGMGRASECTLDCS